MVYTNTLDLCVISAINLWTEGEKDAQFFVAARLISGPDEPTPTTDPASAPYGELITWEFTFQFTVHFTASDRIPPNNDRLVVSLHVLCHHQGQHSYVEEIGELHIPVKDLFDFETRGSSQFAAYKICGRPGFLDGELNLSYKLTGDGLPPPPSAPPLPPPPDPPHPPPLAPERGREREFPVNLAMAVVVAIVVVAPQMGELLVEVQELVVEFIALAVVFLVVVGFVISLPDLLRRLEAHRAR